jgi:hypothetical protein
VIEVAFCFIVLQAPNITATQYAFEEQASRVYSRAVYQEFRDQYYASTGFLMRDDPQKAGYYLVYHRKNKSKFPWLQHEYRVKARYNDEDPEQSVFECECMTWENTGAMMFFASRCLVCCLVSCANTNMMTRCCRDVLCTHNSRLQSAASYQDP